METPFPGEEQFKLPNSSPPRGLAHSQCERCRYEGSVPVLVFVSFFTLWEMSPPARVNAELLCKRRIPVADVTEAPNATGETCPGFYVTAET